MVAPLAVIRREMKAAASGRDPDLAIRHVTVDDDLAAIGALDLENAVLQRPIQVGFARLERNVERAADGSKRAVGSRYEFRFAGHRELQSRIRWIRMVRFPACYVISHEHIVF
jgi:hypothetical protein